MSTILDNWREGKGLPDILVIDGHAHPYQWSPGFRTPEEAADRMVDLMDSYGVDASCLMSGGYMRNGSDYRLGNDFLLDCVRRYPDRLIPFAHINPNDRLASILAELERMVDNGVHAVKLINAYQSYPGDGPNLLAVYAFAQAHNMLVLNHQWTEPEVRRIAVEYPALTMIRGHGGASALSAEFPNVYDNIWSLWPMGVVERGIQRYGPEKILFGSDAAINDPAVGLGMVVYADVPDEHKRLVLGLNMARLLEKIGALPSHLARWLR